MNQTTPTGSNPELESALKSYIVGDFSPGGDGEDVIVISPVKLTELISKHYISRSEAEQRERQARIDEHMSWVKINTEQAHEWEQDGEGSGIQYFDNERLARLLELTASQDKDNPAKKEREENE